MAAGLALAGRTAIAEIMFADFATLAFDMLTNFAAKLPTMYGRPLEARMIVRTATGAGRGYGATHSQSLQKHFLGVPGLAVFEMTRYHDAGDLFTTMLATPGPCLLFEDKVLYSTKMADNGTHGTLLSATRAGRAPGVTRLAVSGPARPDWVLISAGGASDRAVAAAEQLFFAHEIYAHVLVPAQLHPLPVDDLARMAAGAERILVLDESTAGGTWGADVAYELTRRLWSRLAGPIDVVCAAACAIPAAPHLERVVTLQTCDVVARVLKEAGRTTAGLRSS
jgi:pyruvate dehydrogenase E1 component beta subunit